MSSPPNFKDTIVDANHPLIGTWVETRNPTVNTTVAFTIEVKAGRFHVSGLDESDGVSLRVFHTTWDSEKLRFVTLFPPTGHKASHEFWLTRNGRGRHKITYTDEDGEHAANQIWKKRA